MKLIIILLLSLSSVFSLNLKPMYKTIDSPNDIKTTFVVSNPTDKPIAVSFKVLKIKSIKYTKEKRVKTPKILFYPAQFVLAPKSDKQIRVNYLSKKLPKIEETYRILANELDVKIEDPNKKRTKRIETSIQFRMSYSGLMFVKEYGSEMKFKIKKFKELKRNKKFPKQRILDILIENTGYASGILTSKYSLVAKIRGKKYILTSADMKGIGRSLARQKAPFLLKEIKSLPKGKITKLSIILTPKKIKKK